MIRRRKPRDFHGRLIDPAALYRAWQSFASETPRPHTAVGRGDLYAGSDPVVSAHSVNFVLAPEPLPDPRVEATREAA